MPQPTTTFINPLELSILNGANGFRINGVSVNDISGYSVASAGDINGDGLSDLIIGAPYASPGGRAKAGSTYVLFGQRAPFNASLELSTLNGPNGFRINGVSANDWSGYSIASAGDINGDGLSDLIIGATQASPGGRTQAGSSYVVFGQRASFGATLELSTLNGANGFILNGLALGDNSGCSVASAGDINGDSLSDLIIGATNSAPGGQVSAGSSYVVFGQRTPIGATLELSTLNGANGFILNGVAAYDNSGSHVAFAGDMNGDGLSDLIIGAFYSGPGGRIGAGSSYLVFGQSAPFGAVLELSTLNGANGFRLDGITANDYSGYSVVSAGDMNGDGLSDLIIGATQASPGGRTQAGSSYVVFGDNIPWLKNQLNIAEGQSVILGANNLNVNVSRFPELINYKINAAQHGQFEYLNQPNVSITTFSSNDIATNQVRFVTDDSELSPSYAVTAIHTLATSSLSANVTFINQLPILVNNTLVVNQGQTVFFDSTILAAVDADNPQHDPDIVFTISNVLHGIFSSLNFPQSQIWSNGVYFTHDNTIAVPSYQVSISRGGVTVGPESATVHFDASPLLDNNDLRLNQGQTISLSSDMLSATTPYGSASALKFLVKYVQHGRFVKTNAPSIAITAFTQGEIQNGTIQFIHDGTANPPSYKIMVSDGIMTTIAQDAIVEFKYAPVLIANALIINQGQTVILNPSILAATNLDYDATQLLFNISNIHAGHFEYTNMKNVSITQFLQAEIQSGLIEFVHDGSTLLPSYQVSISNGLMTVGSYPVAVSFDRTPILVNNKLAISQGQSMLLGNQQLSATSQDINPFALLFELSNVQYGHFEVIGQPGIPVTSFTQGQVLINNIQFIQDGSENSPSYNITVSDGRITTTPQMAVVSFNLPPVLTVNQMRISQGQSLILNANMINATDPDDPVSSISFTVGNVQHAHFESVNNVGVPISTFSETAVMQGKVRFIDDGSTLTPSYTVSVSDGKMSTVAQSSQLNFNLAPVLSNNALQIGQNQTKILSAEDLSASDLDDPISNLVFTVSNVNHGAFIQLPQTQFINNFTQGAIEQGQIAFKTDGGADAPLYMVSVSDGYGQTQPVAAHINFNSAPILTNNRLSITPGNLNILSSSDLSASDKETALGDLVFTASNVINGHFELAGISGTAISVFAQQKIFSGDIAFISDGTELPAYNIRVSDGSLTAGPQAATVSLNSVVQGISSTSADNTVRNAIIGASVSGGIGLLFLATKLGIGYVASKRTQKALEGGKSDIEKEQATYLKDVVRPIATRVFESIKTTGCMGNQSLADAKDYIAAVEVIIEKLRAKGVGMELKNMAPSERSQLINEIARQTRKFTVPNRPFYSMAKIATFCRPEVKPEQIEAKAEVIAAAVTLAVANNASTPAPLSPSRYAPEVELQEMQMEKGLNFSELKEDLALVKAQNAEMQEQMKAQHEQMKAQQTLMEQLTAQRAPVEPTSNLPGFLGPIVGSRHTRFAKADSAVNPLGIMAPKMSGLGLAGRDALR